MQVEKETTEKKSNKLSLYITLDIILLILSIIIPFFLVNLNQTGSCLHHIEDSDGSLWIVGRALGFTTLIWFIISTIYGIRTKKLARVFKSYKKARDFHCLNAILTNIIFMIHVASLLLSDPWGALIFDGEYNHIPFPLFMTKLWTGIIFGIIMFSVSMSAFYFRDMNRMKRFGFKNFKKIHYIMLSLSILLGIHVFLINTELLVIFWG
ncbi:MAG: hypothetical protein ACTSPN_16860 [Promethearchaeota archaeon]